MTRHGGRRWRRHLFLALAAVLAVILLVPIERYRVCVGERWDCLYLEGPLRKEYADILTKALSKEGFFHIRIGNEVFVKVVYPLQAFTRPRIYRSLSDFLLNNEHRFGSSLLAGYGANGRYEPPAPLRAIRDRQRAHFEQELASRNEKREWDPFDRTFDFEVYYATFIQVEDMDPQRRLHFIPTSPRPAKCGLSGLRAWSSTCGSIVRGTGENAVIVRKARDR